MVISFSCALLAISLQQWARRYVRLTQPARRSPEKRARIRAFYARGVDKMQVPWAVEGLPTLIHLSLFLFFIGLIIFLFNIDREVFTSVAWWIGLFSMLYGLITLLPIIRHDSPYYTPLSIPVWFLLSILFVFFQFLASIGVVLALLPMILLRRGRIGMMHGTELWDKLTHKYKGRLAWILGGVENKAEKMTQDLSRKIDLRIFGLTLTACALGDDDSLEEFFGAIPGLFSSKLAKNLEADLPEKLLKTFWDALDGFMGRTLSSNLVTKQVKSHREAICRNVMSMIPYPAYQMPVNLQSYYAQAPVSIETIQAMARWRTNKVNSVAKYAEVVVARDLLGILEGPELSTREWDDWIALVSGVTFLSAHYLRANINHARDNLLLVTLIRVLSRGIHHDEVGLVGALTQFDICHTLPGLQNSFCERWNSLIQSSKGSVSYTTSILYQLRLHYNALHPRKTGVSRSTYYRVCENGSHDAMWTLRNQPGGIIRYLNPINLYIGGIPWLQPRSICSLYALPHQYTTNGNTFSRQGRQVEESSIFPGSRQDIATAGAVSASNPPPPVSSVVSFSTPTSLLLALLSSATPSHPAGTATLPPLCVRGLVNTGSMCFVNAVLQLLVHSPPFWNLFRELGDLKGQRGAADLEAGGGATPLVDSTLRFFEEFMVEEPPRPQRQSPQSAEGLGWVVGDSKEERDSANSFEEPMYGANSFEPTYMYDAMKEKRRLNNLLVRFCGWDARGVCY